MQRADQQQARELAQLHRTMAKMANMLERQTALPETQWQAMKTWVAEKEEKRDAYHQEDILCAEGITDMVARVAAATERGKREERIVDTEGVSLEAATHTDLMQTGEPKKPEVRQQLQPGRQLKSVPTLKPNPNPNPNPNQYQKQHQHRRQAPRRRRKGQQHRHRHLRDNGRWFHPETRRN